MGQQRLRQRELVELFNLQQTDSKLRVAYLDQHPSRPGHIMLSLARGHMKISQTKKKTLQAAARLLASISGPETLVQISASRPTPLNAIWSN